MRVIVTAACVLLACGVDPIETERASLSPSSGRPLVFTTSGLVRGTIDAGRQAFRGIPYAAPPVGPLRFADPTFPRPWAGVRDALELGPLCPQIAFGGSYQGDEDCLRLNVYAPAGATARSRLPVLVWIHGGGQRRGNVHVLDGMTLPLEGMVVVTIHYRLNLLGYFAHPALSAEQGGSSGNARLYDQAMALLWTRLNIAGFGGDPTRILVAGQSAGGWDTQLLLGSRAAGVVFDRAASVSASDVPDWPFATLAEGEAAGVAVAARLGCSGAPAEQLACLRALPAQALVEDDRAFPYAVPAVVDGRLFPENPYDVVTRGAAVPFMIGSTREEILDSFDPATPEDEVLALFSETFGDLADEILALYPFSAYPTPGWAYATAFADRYFACVDRHTSQTVAAAGAAPVYRYLFAHGLTNDPPTLGAYHRLDIGFILGDIDSNSNGPYEPTADELALSETMMGYWMRFAGSGDPNGGGAPAWPPVAGIGDESLQILDVPIVHAPAWHVEACQLQRPL